MRRAAGGLGGQQAEPVGGSPRRQEQQPGWPRADLPESSSTSRVHEKRRSFACGSNKTASARRAA